MDVRTEFVETNDGGLTSEDSVVNDGEVEEEELNLDNSFEWGKYGGNEDTNGDQEEDSTCLRSVSASYDTDNDSDFIGSTDIDSDFIGF